jgi:xanthine dehydrogenase accessory factor
VKHWTETRQVLDRVAALHSANNRAALATVVRVRGSAYRHEGAKLVVADDESSVGNVSGGCLEADVREVAARVIATGVAECRTYCGGADEVAAWDLGVGCDGDVEILIEPVRSTFADVRAALADQQRVMTVTSLADDAYTGVSCRRMVLTESSAAGSLGTPELDAQIRSCASEWMYAGESRVVELDGTRVFVDVLVPPPRLVVVSAGDDAQVLARLANEVGFRVVVVDRRNGLLTRERFAAPITLLDADAARLNEVLVLDGGALCVVMTHSFADDTAYLRALLRTPARYLGMLGPRQRTDRILAVLRNEAPVDEARIFGPVGLDIGTDGAEQVAVAILAELLAVCSGRQPQSLRDRRAPIHAGNGLIEQ